MIPIAKPIMTKKEIQAVVDVMKSGQIANGHVVTEFENKFAFEMDAIYGVATNNGTSALHAAYLASTLQKGDKVITTPFTFVATANTLLFCDLTPVFVDINPNTFNIDADSIEQALQDDPSIKGLVVVHLFGQPCEMDKIMPLVKKYGLVLVEDCAQSHMATYKDQYVGTFGEFGTFSFYPTKNMTTSEGGMIVTNSPQSHELLKSIINHGQGERYEYQMLGHNFRMTNIEAAIGLVQLKQLSSMTKKRIKNAKFYLKNIQNPSVTLPTILDDVKHVFHQFTVKVQDRQDFTSYLSNNGIGYGIYYPTLLTEQPIYESLGFNATSTPTAKKVAQQVVSIPVHPALQVEELQKIVEVINRYGE